MATRLEELRNLGQSLAHASGWDGPSLTRRVEMYESDITLERLDGSRGKLDFGRCRFGKRYVDAACVGISEASVQ